jgi:membrane associated rhomboid family serine protease
LAGTATSRGLPDAGRTRRHPWVSYVGCTFLLAGSLLLLLGSGEMAHDAASTPEFQAAQDFFERNPDVVLTGTIERLFDADLVAEVRTAHEAKRAAGGVARLSKRMRAKTQKRFDAIEREALASFERLPRWRFGITDSSTAPQNYLLHLVVNETLPALAVSAIFLVLMAVTLEGAWGSAIFGSFFVLLPFVSGGTYVMLFGRDGVPWVGPSALVAALLGAYFIRSFMGFVIPGWLLLPAWAVCEYLVARDISIEHFDSTPVTVHAFAFGFGAVAALTVAISGLENKLQRSERESPDLISNPVLEQALEARERGKSEIAFDLLERELRRSPDNYDVAAALWEIARVTDNCTRVAPAMLSSVRHALRGNLHAEATSLWTALTLDVPDPKAEPTLLVRIGERLLDAGHPEVALNAFALAVDGPKRLSAVLASRVVRAARDLDPQLTRRAAAAALVDDQLDPAERAAMQTIVERVEPEAPAFTADRREEPRPVAAAEPRPLEIEPAAEVAAAAPADPDPDPYQDPNAISVDDFEDTGSPADSADPNAWNQPGLVEDLSAELDDDSLPTVGAGSSEPWDGLGQDPDSGSGEISETTETYDALESSASGDPGTPVADALDEFSEIAVPKRALRARPAVPLGLTEQGVSCEVEGGSKTLLPYARIEAVAAGAVRGLSQKPVVVIDLVLNWMGLPDEPLKVVRFRSDGFDPRRVVPNRATPLESLRGMLDTILRETGATPLPDVNAAKGTPFLAFASLDDYHAEVLMVERG